MTNNDIQWETHDGETNGYLEDGREIAITARTRYNRWGGVDSNVREWFITDPDNKRIAAGKADGLRAAKAAAVAALDTAAGFSIGQTVTVEDRAGAVVALQPAADSISGKAEVRVELQPYGNRAWFAADTVKPSNGIAGMAWTD